MAFGFSDNWSPNGKNCYVTGGSQGLGLSLALLLARKGANVSIVARNVQKLEIALQELEKCRQTEDQVFRSHSSPLNSSAGSSAALNAECLALTQHSSGLITTPDAFFLCAGSSRPLYFIEESPQSLTDGLDQSYWVQAWSAHAIFRKLVEERQPGRIWFVGSTLSCMSFLGWSSYAPGKHALKGLAETLRSEGVLYDIDVGIFFAPTMDSPGYAEEIKSKPEMTRRFEEGDEVLSCDRAAELFLEGVQANHHHCAATFLGKVFYNSSRGAAPLTNPILGPIFDCISWVGIPFWRRDCDAKIREHKEEHRQYLVQKGLVPSLPEAKKSQ